MTPLEPGYKYITGIFKSSFLEVNGKEPEITFPTGLKGPFYDSDPANCLDYIL